MKNKLKKLNLSMLTILSVFSGLMLSSCQTPNTSSIQSNITSNQGTISFKEASVRVMVDEHLTLELNKSSDEEVIWESDHEEIAVVENGIVTGISEGEAVITATLKDSGANAYCIVTVYSNTMPVLTLDRSEAELCVGGSDILVRGEVTYGGNKVPAEIEWSSSNTAIATVKNGLITPISDGECIITAIANYQNKISQATVNVLVRPNLMIEVSKTSIDLTTYKLNPEDSTTETIKATLFVNGVKSNIIDFELAVDGDSAIVSKTADGIKITASKVGQTTIKVKYEDDKNNKTETQVIVNVTRPKHVEEKNFLLNINDKHATLDFTGLSFAEDVVLIYDGDTPITSVDNPLKINQEWLQSLSVGSTKSLRVDCGQYDSYITVTIDNQFMDLTFTLKEEGRDGSTLESVQDPSTIGFNNNDNVLKWNPSGNNWNDRLGVEDLKEFDYWTFDVMLTQKITSELDFWIGSQHVIQITNNGSISMFERGGYAGDNDAHKKENCLKIFDTNNRLVLGEMQPNTRYTIEINLAHRGNKGLYEMGIAQNSTMYIANPTAYKAAYYEKNIGIHRDTNVINSLKVEKNLIASHTLDFSDYSWSEQIEGLYIGETRISSNTDVKTISSEWIQNQAVGSYELIVKLNDGTTFRGLLEIALSMVETNYFLPNPNGGATIQDVSDPTKVGFEEGQTVQKYYSGAQENNNWNNRIESSADINLMNWWIFDISFTEDVFTGQADKDVLVIWVASGHVLMVKADGSIGLYSGGANYKGTAAEHAEDNCCKIYNSEGQLNEGKLLPNQKYTFEINTSHKGNSPRLYEIGCYASTTYYIGNSFACTDDYYNAFVKDKVGINKRTADLEINEQLQLEATINGDDNLTKTWSSSDSNVATVSNNGLVTAVGYGSATITISIDNGRKACCKINVIDHSQPIINLNTTDVTLVANESQKVTANITDYDGNTIEATVNWKSLDSDIAIVDNGTITGVNVGSTKVQASVTVNGKTATQTINVYVGGFEKLSFGKRGSNGADTYDVFNGDVTSIGFEDGAVVNKWHCGSNVWDDRLGVDNLASFDYWIFDFSLEQELNDDSLIDLWIGSNHVIQIHGEGGITMLEQGGFSGDAEAHNNDNCVKIYNSSNQLVSNQKLAAKTKYTMVISLSHRGNKSLYEMGCDMIPCDIYISNVYACSQKYFDVNLAAKYN